MAALAVSAADAAWLARVPALLEALRGPTPSSALRKTLRALSAASSVARGVPNHPSAVDALLSAGLVPLLLSLCVRGGDEAGTRLGTLPFKCLRHATRFREAASDQLGLAGFCELLSVAERNAALAPEITSILKCAASSLFVKAAMFGEAGSPTLRHLLSFVDRFPSGKLCEAVAKLLDTAPAASSQAFFECGGVAWLDRSLRRCLSLAPDQVAAAGTLMLISRRLLETRDHRKAMQPLFLHFACALSLLLRLPMSDDLARLAAC